MSRIVGVLQFLGVSKYSTAGHKHLFVSFMKNKDFTSLAIKHILAPKEQPAGWKNLSEEGLEIHYTPFRLEVIYDD